MRTADRPRRAAIDLLCVYIDAGAFNQSDDALVAVLHEGGDFCRSTGQIDCFAFIPDS